jgi:hypothetical protein
MDKNCAIKSKEHEFQVNFCCQSNCVLITLQQSARRKSYCLHYLLPCAHSICALCLVHSAQEDSATSGHLTCSLCQHVTILDESNQTKFRALQSSCASVQTLQDLLLTTNLFPEPRDCLSTQHFPLDRLLTSRLFGLGQVRLSKPVELVQIDEDSPTTFNARSKTRLQAASSPRSLFTCNFLDRPQSSCYTQASTRITFFQERISSNVNRFLPSFSLLQFKKQTIWSDFWTNT